METRERPHPPVDARRVETSTAPPIGGGHHGTYSETRFPVLGNPVDWLTIGHMPPNARISVDILLDDGSLFHRSVALDLIELTMPEASMENMVAHSLLHGIAPLSGLIR